MRIFINACIGLGLLVAGIIIGWRIGRDSMAAEVLEQTNDLKQSSGELQSSVERNQPPKENK